MNELTINNFETLKSELNKELVSTAQSVCRIGYLLKLARDTDILNEGGYADVYDFAFAEYGLDKSQVSRFMNINDRFSIGGNSEQLLPEYKDYGSSKLSIMLTLPEEINEELSPEMSKSDILAVKEEYDEEQKITPIEHMAEDTSGVPDDLIAAAVKQLNDEHPEPAELMHEALDLGQNLNLPEGWSYENDAKEYYMPDGDKTYIVNIPGRGRHMIKCTDEQLIITCMADMNKTQLSWGDFAAAVMEDVSHRDFGKKVEDKPKAKPKKVEKSKKPEKPKAEAKEAPPKKEEPEAHKEAAGEAKTEAAGAEEHTEAGGETEEHTEAAGEEARKLKRIANDLRALADQFDAGTGGNLYSNPIEELEGMIDEINSLPGELIPIVEDAIRRIKPKEEEE